jgi:hypothetical protein
LLNPLKKKKPKAYVHLFEQFRDDQLNRIFSSRCLAFPELFHSFLVYTSKLVVHETRLGEIYIEAIYSIYDFEIHVFQKYLLSKMHALQSLNILRLTSQIETSDIYKKNFAIAPKIHKF